MKKKAKNIVSSLVVSAIVTSVAPVKPFAQEIYFNDNVKKEEKSAIEYRNENLFAMDNNRTTTKYSFQISELVGNDRFDTAVKVSQTGWSTSQNAVLVNASSLTDALSVTPFAAQEDAPVLLSDVNNLNPTTKSEIIRLGVKNVYVIGGTSAISENIVNELKSMGITVERISGEDRYKTSLAIANRFNNVSEIAVVNGEKGFADAVSIAPVCARDNMAIVYASPQNGLSTFNDFMKTHNIKTSYIIGGTNVLSNELVSTLNNPVRIAGADRNSTNLDIIKKFYSNGNNNKIELKNIFVAKNGYGNQNDLIDALSVGVIASKQNSPIMLVSPKGLDSNQRAILSDISIKQIIKVGGNGNEDAFNQITEIVDNKVNAVINVNRLINSLPNPGDIKANDEKKLIEQIKQVEEARIAFEALSPEQKKSIPDIQIGILVADEQKIALIKEPEKAEKLVERIDKLASKQNIELSDVDEVVAIRHAYELLTDKSKRLVNNYKELERIERELLHLPRN